MESNLRNTVIAVFIVAVIVAIVLFRGCGGDETPTPAVEPVTEDVTSTPATGAGAPPGPQGRLVDVGGHRLFIRTFGTASPAVVVEPGIGDPMQVWGELADTLSRDYEVVLYARAGYQGSDPGPMPRSADRVVRDLTQLLVDTPIEPPYIVVGHSLGAIHALLYASEHPQVVDGLVLLDPPPLAFLKGERFPRLRQAADDMTAEFRNQAEAARAVGDVARANQLEAVASEHEQMFATGWSWMESVKSLGDMPLVVIASGEPNPSFGDDAEEFQEFWRKSTEDLAMLSQRSRYLYLEHSSHDIPDDAPGAVIEAIRWCAAQPDIDPVGHLYEGDK